MLYNLIPIGTFHGVTYVSTVLVPESVTDENTERTTVVKYSDMVSSTSSISDSDSDYGPQDTDSESDGEAERERLFRLKNREVGLHFKDTFSLTLYIF